MAQKLYKPVLIESITAGEDLQKQRFIGFDGKTCQAGAKALGICDAETEKGQCAPVGVIGILLIEAGGNITAGDEVASDSDGRAVTVARTELPNGFALDSAEEGDVIRIVRGI